MHSPFEACKRRINEKNSRGSAQESMFAGRVQTIVFETIVCGRGERVLARSRDETPTVSYPRVRPRAARCTTRRRLFSGAVGLSKRGPPDLRQPDRAGTKVAVPRCYGFARSRSSSTSRRTYPRNRARSTIGRRRTSQVCKGVPIPVLHPIVQGDRVDGYRGKGENHFR
jgi:hypothetical protein